MKKGRAKAAALLCGGFESSGGLMQNVCKNKLEHNVQGHKASVCSYMECWSRCESLPCIVLPGLALFCMRPRLCECAAELHS